MAQTLLVCADHPRPVAAQAWSLHENQPAAGSEDTPMYIGQVEKDCPGNVSMVREKTPPFLAQTTMGQHDPSHTVVHLTAQAAALFPGASCMHPLWDDTASVTAEARRSPAWSPLSCSLHCARQYAGSAGEQKTGVLLPLLLVSPGVSLMRAAGLLIDLPGGG